MENAKWLWGKTWIIHKCGVLPSSRICLTFLWSTKSNINYIQTIYETPWNTFFFTLLLSFWFRIQRLRQNGILHLQGLTYWHSIDKCLNLKIDRSKNSQLSLYDFVRIQNSTTTWDTRASGGQVTKAAVSYAKDPGSIPGQTFQCQNTRNAYLSSRKSF